MATLSSVPQPMAYSRRGLALLLASVTFSLALGACASTSKASERYIVLESRKFT